MSLPSRTALRRLLALAVSGGLVLVLGLLGLLAGWQASERAMDTHVADRLQIQLTLAGLTDQYVRTSAGDLQSHVGPSPWDAATAPGRLRRVVDGSLFVDAGAVLLDGTGRPLAAWTPPGAAVPATDDPGWEALRQGVLARRLPVSGVLAPGAAPVSAVAVPVTLDGGGTGLVVGLTATRVTALQGYVEGLTYGRTGHGYVVDDRGLVLAAPQTRQIGLPLADVPLPAVLDGGPSGVHVYGEGEDRRIVSWGRAGSTGWTSLTVQDEAEFAGPLRSAGRRAQALVAALLLIAGTGLVVLHRKREAALERVALRDDLTGLYNRRGWFSLATAELDRAARQGRERVLVFVDLDGLKQVNDVLGHREGDRAITAAAAVLTAASRPGDVVGRLGGDEFVLLLGEDGEAETARLRLLAAVDAHNVRSSAPFELRLSLGAEVWFPQSQVSLDELVRRADACMYADKSARPDRCAGLLRVPAPRDGSEDRPLRQA